MREGFSQDDDKKEEARRRRRGSEDIDQDEAPQVVIPEKEKDLINVDEARAFVVEKEGAKLDKLNEEKTNNGTMGNVSSKPKNENVSLGMKRARKTKEGVKRVGQEGKETSVPEKSRKAAPRKEKRLKLSFEED
jgi:hypothetical protein